MLVKEAWLDNLNWILDDADWWLMLFVIGCCYKELDQPRQKKQQAADFCCLFVILRLYDPCLQYSDWMSNVEKTFILSWEIKVFSTFRFVLRSSGKAPANSSGQSSIRPLHPPPPPDVTTWCEIVLTKKVYCTSFSWIIFLESEGSGGGGGSWNTLFQHWYLICQE